jgi:hypothetical protein
MVSTRRLAAGIVCGSLLLAVAPGCGHDRPDTQSSAADRPLSTAPSPDGSRDEAHVEAPLAESLTIGSGEGPAAGDPGEEGWVTEAFSEEAVAQLKKLGHLLERNAPPTSSELSPLITADFAAQPTIPTPLDVVHQNTAITVQRREKPSHDSSSERLELDDAAAWMAPLQTTFAGLDHCKSKFKLFRVESSGAEVVTTQYVHLAGYRASVAREYNATWRIGWRKDSDTALPRIHWVRVDEVEQVTAKIADHPWLVDCTMSLLANEHHAQTLLRPGIDFWMSRIEQVRGVYAFGYHGLAIGDVNGDRLDDLYVCQAGGLANQLLIQQPDGTLRDVSAAAGVDYLDSTRSALLVDLDNDGDQDLILALATGLLLLENQGSGQFRERARIASIRQGFSLAAADYDQDGLLDFYVCVYYGDTDGANDLPLPLPYFDATNGGANYLIRNRGQWQFEDVTEQVGLSDDNRRFSFAAAWEDVDRDGDLDLLVVNDFGPNHLYRNDHGQFRNVAEDNGLMDGAFGMSATLGDYDRDGNCDIYVSNMFSAAGNRITFQTRFKPEQSEQTRARFQHLARGNSLFRNRGDGTYEDVSVQQRVTMGRWSWGSLFVDLDNDGWEDLLVTNGFITGSKTDDL